MKLKTIITSIITCLGLLSCNSLDSIQGNGPVNEKIIHISKAFNTIKTSRGLNVELIPGNENKAIIKANENLLDIIKVSVTNNILHITSDKNIRRATSKKVFITFKNIEKLIVNSGSFASNKGFLKNKDLYITVHSGAHAKLNTKSDSITCNVHSGAKLELDGFTNSSNIQAHSGSNVLAQKLKSKKSNVVAHSGAHVKTYSNESFTGNAHSGASIRYAGNPKNVSKKTHSGGNIYEIK